MDYSGQYFSRISKFFDFEILADLVHYDLALVSPGYPHNKN